MAASWESDGGYSLALKTVQSTAPSKRGADVKGKLDRTRNMSLPRRLQQVILNEFVIIQGKAEGQPSRPDQ